MDNQALPLSDWLEELAVFGQAANPIHIETAHSLSLMIYHGHLVRLALEPRSSSVTCRARQSAVNV